VTQQPESDRDLVDATRRTLLANERTYLAWLRTALTAMAVAIGVGRIVPGVTSVTRWPFEVVGAGFALLGVAVLVYGALRFLRVEQALAAGQFAPLQVKAAVGLAAAAAVVGIGTLAIVFLH
jgi:putative membrane protein